MKKALTLFVLTAVSVVLHSCVDHDDPQLMPIDTSQVTISASVSSEPDLGWLNVTEELTINVSNVEMKAPKGVVLRSISLIANNGMSSFMIDDKPYSGQPLQFKIPLIGLKGRINFSLRGNLIKQDSRDAQIIIADNIQRIIFSETPEFECEGWLHVSVTSVSDTGEEYSNSFEVTSSDHFTISIPQSELYWTPSTGTASTLEVTLGAGANVWSPNTTFKCSISKTALGHSSDGESTLKITIPNSPGALKSQNLQLYVLSSYFGTWEDVTIDPHNKINIFAITETE